jgi:hypothetical protein
MIWMSKRTNEIVELVYAGHFYMYAYVLDESATNKIVLQEAFKKNFEFIGWL